MTITNLAQDFAELEEEDKSLILTQMKESIDYSYRIFRLVEKQTDSMAAQELNEKLPDNLKTDYDTSVVDVEELLSILPPINNDQQTIVLMRLAEVVMAMGVCSCAIHKFSHSLHHVLYDPQLKEIIAQRNEEEDHD